MNLHPPCEFPLMTLSSGQLCEGTQTAWVDGQSSDLWNSEISHYTSLLNALVIIRRKESGTRESLRLVCTTHFKRKMNSSRSLCSSKEKHSPPPYKKQKQGFHLPLAAEAVYQIHIKNHIMESHKTDFVKVFMKNDNFMRFILMYFDKIC